MFRELVEEDYALRSALAVRGALFGEYHEAMEQLHVKNGLILQEWIEQHGWPGQPESDAAWIIVIHAISLPSLQRQALQLLQNTESSVTPAQLATLEDRILVNSDLLQHYGTQLDWNEGGELSPYPIERSDSVDQRRAAVGLPPLDQEISRLRQQALLEGERPPEDWHNYRQRRRNWQIRVGWIKGDSNQT